MVEACGLIWCPGQDLNLHVLRHTPLKRACLPVSPPGQWVAKVLFILHYANTQVCISDSQELWGLLRSRVYTPISFSFPLRSNVLTKVA